MFAHSYSSRLSRVCWRNVVRSARQYCLFRWWRKDTARELLVSESDWKSRVDADSTFKFPTNQTYLRCASLFRQQQLRRIRCRSKWSIVSCERLCFRHLRAWSRLRVASRQVLLRRLQLLVRWPPDSKSIAVNMSLSRLHILFISYISDRPLCVVVYGWRQSCRRC